MSSLYERMCSEPVQSPKGKFEEGENVMSLDE